MIETGVLLFGRGLVGFQLGDLRVDVAQNPPRMIDAGTDPKEAFRDVLGQVRDLLQND